MRTVIGEMTVSVPLDSVDKVGVRMPVSGDELEDLVAVLSKPDPRVPSNWSRRFKNHQEKLKSGDVYQVAEVVRNLAARNRDARAVGGRAHHVRARPHQPGVRDRSCAQGDHRRSRAVPRRSPRQRRPSRTPQRPPQRSNHLPVLCIFVADMYQKMQRTKASGAMFSCGGHGCSRRPMRCRRLRRGHCTRSP